MHVALWMVSLAAVVVTVAAASRRVGLPAPVVLVAAGMAASYLPFVPEFRLTSELVLVGLLPPLLYNAALQTSLVDFTTHRRAILSLSIGLVAFTTAGVAVVLHVVLPGLTWPAAFAIGAVVAPPDAVAATAVGRRIGLPRRLVTILEGESLLNDATALVALNTAILAAAGTATFTRVEIDFAVAAGGGVACGVLVYVVVGWVRKHVTDPVIDTSVSLATPFVAYVAAEEVHASGVLAVVIAGLLLGHKAPVLQSASSRIAERLNWRTVAFLLENAVFLLIGLQASWIFGEVGRSQVAGSTIALACAAALVAVVVLRMLWVFPARYLIPLGNDRSRVPRSYTAVLGWAGMRGVVTLAAAFAIPAEAPHREVLLLVALVVTAGTLTLQGLSLPWLVRRLGVPAPDARADALVRAELLQLASRAGLARLARSESRSGAAGGEQDRAVRDVLRTRLEQRDFAAWERLGPEEPEDETPSERYARLRLDMLAAERESVLEVRSRGQVPHEVVEEVLTALDVEESMIDQGVRRRRAFADAEPAPAVEPPCEHLRSAVLLPEPEDRRCVDCVREGTTWVHLRQCLDCGHVGCCDSSPRRHATAHHRSTGHPVVRSAEVGEGWRWCFVDERVG
ncbi:MAG TPA: cation:proton antiporter [Marmoricola sp.]|nr:cation:proton antiporter [Marmoricola sp.]